MQSIFTRIAYLPAPVRLLAFLSLLALFWLPVAGLIVWRVHDSNRVTILTMAVLAVEFLILIPIWGRSLHKEANIFRRYGLSRTSANGTNLIVGLVVGLLSLLGLFVIEGWMGLLTWRSPSSLILSTVLEGLLVALGVGFAEELVFRGWVLDELQRDYRAAISLWGSSAIYAVLHFLKPLEEILRTLPQFPGLVLLGLLLVWAKRRTKGQLGLSIGLHAGLVWGYYIVQVGHLVDYTSGAPAWLIGIDRNPLAGGLGLVVLSLLAFFIRYSGPTPRPLA